MGNKFSRISDKIKEIEGSPSKLEETMTENLEKYISDFKSKAACERFTEVIIESSIDLSFLTIKALELKSPESEESSFDIFKEEKIISEELSRKLKLAKGMRNILAHEYGKIDDEVVFESIKDELSKDIGGFVKAVSKIIENENI